MNMRCNQFCGLGLSITVFLGGLSLASIASAQTIATPPPANGTATHAGHGVVVAELRRAHRLLVEADHDYDGHRAKAAQAVHAALKELGYQHKKVQPVSPAANGAVAPPATAKARQPKMHEPQATSDAQLREALQILQGTLTQMKGKHPKATANLNTAVVEINTALGIK